MFGLPELASVHGEEVDALIIWIHWFMLALAVGWGAFFIYCLVRFRASANPVANYAGTKGKVSKYVEAGVVLFETFLLLAFAFPIWHAWTEKFPAQDEATVVKVVAEQFAWNFHYPGEDGVFGKRSIDLIDVQSNPLGLDRKNDPNAKDDITTLNQLHLPVDKNALLLISSKDVIHSFKQIEMRVTQDAVPGLEIPVAFIPNKTGKYEIACAQLCGIGHYKMRGFITIDTEEKFNSWITEQAELQADTGEEVW